MKSALLGICMALLALSTGLWYELRVVSRASNSYVISQYHSALVNARGLEGLLREGRLADAHARLQDLRDASVLGLSAVASATGASRWRWSHDTVSLTRAEQALRDEASYRRAVGESQGLLGAQVVAALAAYR